MTTDEARAALHVAARSAYGGRQGEVDRAADALIAAIRAEQDARVEEWKAIAGDHAAALQIEAAAKDHGFSGPIELDQWLIQHQPELRDDYVAYVAALRETASGDVAAARRALRNRAISDPSTDPLLDALIAAIRAESAQELAALREALLGADTALSELIADGWSSLSVRRAFRAQNEVRAALAATPAEDGEGRT